MLKKKNNSKINAEFLENDESVLITCEVGNSNVTFLLEFPTGYPFEAPELKILSKFGLESLVDISKSESALELVLCEKWLPVKSLNDIIESLSYYVNQSYKPIERSVIIDIFNTRGRFPLILLLILIVRVLVINFPHMDWDKGPSYGPYESFRYAMETTLNFPMKDWYSSIKDPPLYSYLAYFLSNFAHLIDGDSVDPFSYPGYQSFSSKIFMRFLVIFFEFLVLMTGIYRFICIHYKNITECVQLATCWVVLISPSIVIIGHVFFSISVVSNGLLIWSISLIYTENYNLCSVLLSLALSLSLETYPAVLSMSLILVLNLYSSSLQRTKNVSQYRVLIFLAEFGIKIFSIVLCFVFPIAILSSPWLDEVELGVLFNLHSITALKSESIFQILIKSNKIAQVIVSAFMVVPVFYQLTLNSSRQFKCFSTIFCISMCFYLLSDPPGLNQIVFLNLLFSLFNIIETPEVFRYFSIISASTLYPQCISDGSRLAYFGLIVIFYILSHYLNRSLNYLQNRSNLPLHYFYIIFILVHSAELVDSTLFQFLLSAYTQSSFIIFYIWVLFIKTRLDSQNRFFIDSSSSNKNKNT